MSEVLARSRAVVHGALAAIEAAREHINDQNVYPVPDGDTGTNLALTVAAIADALDAAPDDTAPAEVAALVRRAALMGGRGNSGIILSQIVRGLCDVLATAPDASQASLAAALRGASDAAYRAVRQPVEGTILTVVREIAEAAEAAGDGELRPAVLAAGADAVARTPELLAVLRDAGVVDAGGAGLLEIVRGAFAGLHGETAEAMLPATAAFTADHRGEPSRYRYCTSYVVSGPGVVPTALEAQLSVLGDSLIVVGDADATKVHVHTDDPGRALSAATAMGALAAVEVADMHGQIVDRSRRLAPVAEPPVEHRATDVVIVLQGEGNREIAESMGARRVLAGGQSMNPSTGDLVQALRRPGADGVILLPCNPNVVGAARAAVEAVGGHCVLVEALSIPAGLAALVAYDPAAPAELNAVTMRAAAAAVRSAEVTRAVRSARVDGVDVREGDWIGLVEGTVTDAGPDVAAVVEAVAARLVGDDTALVTALLGAGADGDARVALDALRGCHPAIEFDVRDGGQPFHTLLLGAE